MATGANVLNLQVFVLLVCASQVRFTSVTLLYKKRIETFNDFFVFFSNVALFRSDCMIIEILF